MGNIDGKSPGGTRPLGGSDSAKRTGALKKVKDQRLDLAGTTLPDDVKKVRDEHLKQHGHLGATLRPHRPIKPQDGDPEPIRPQPKYGLPTPTQKNEG